MKDVPRLLNGKFEVSFYEKQFVYTDFKVNPEKSLLEMGIGSYNFQLVTQDMLDLFIIDLNRVIKENENLIKERVLMY